MVQSALRQGRSFLDEIIPAYHFEDYPYVAFTVSPVAHPIYSMDIMRASRGRTQGLPAFVVSVQRQIIDL